MKGKNQVSKQEMSSMVGKWFTMTSKDEDGNIYQNVVYCAEIMENGMGYFVPVNPDPSLDWKKLSYVDAVHFDMAPINNFVYRYFNTLLEKMTFTEMEYPELMEEAMFLTCFYMVTDEKLHGDDIFPLGEYITTEAFDRIQEKWADTEELMDAYCTVHNNMVIDLSRYLSFYEELYGVTGRDKNPFIMTGYKSYLNRSEWAKEKEWCSSHPIV